MFALFCGLSAVKLPNDNLLDRRIYALHGYEEPQ